MKNPFSVFFKIYIHIIVKNEQFKTKELQNVHYFISFH